MRTKDQYANQERIKWKYKNLVNIPENMKMFFWNEHNKAVPLEKLIMRIFEYGNFEEIKWLN